MKSTQVTYDQLAQLIDHTNLKPYATADDFRKLCDEARKYHFRMVAINSYPVRMCKEFLLGSDVHVGAAIAFPLGQMSIEAKCFETLKAIEDGSDEIDYVLNIAEVRQHNYEYIRKEMEAIVGICKEKGKTVKVILEICYLDEKEIIKVSQIAKEVKPDFIKTSTGFGPSGATVEAVRLMKETVGAEVKVKAAGGIRDLKTCLEMIDAGAERIGTSSSVKIMEEFKTLHKN